MTSIIGYHYSTGGNKTGIGGWIDYATQRGIPVGLKGVSDYGLIFEAIQKGNPGWFVYRLSAAAGSVSREVPNYTVDPVIDAEALAAETLSKLPPEFDKTKVWLELINEPRGKWTDEPVWGSLHPVDYLGEWCLAAAGFLNAQGYKFCGPGFNSGEPGDDGKPLSDVTAQYLQPGMRAYLQYCADNPDMAALAVHEYIWLGPITYPGLWGRFEAAIAAADLAGIPRTFPIFVTEWGFAPNNAPDMPAAVPYLDYYNKLAARFPQVKFAAAWTLQSGYDPVDDKIITWVAYPINKAFDAGEQPAVTHTAFGGTLPDDTEEPMDNLLYNPSFELGHHEQNGDPNQQLADGWQGTFKTDAPYVQPEFNNKEKPYVPQSEWPLFFKDGDKTTKIFKGGLPCNFQFKTDPAAQPNLINLAPGRYRYSFWIYPDVVDRYENNQKVFSDNPLACRIRLFWNGVQGNWQSLHPYGGAAMRQIVYEWEHTGGDAIVGFQTDCPIKPSSATKGTNGIFTDMHEITLIEDNPMTWEQQLAAKAESKKVLAFKKGASLQTRITADGFQARTNEFNDTLADGVTPIVCRGAIHPGTAEIRVYYAQTSDYGDVRYIVVSGGASTPPPFEFKAYPVPEQSYFITSAFNAGRPSYPPTTNQKHEGVDLRAPFGTPIAAVADGVVDGLRLDPGKGYGTYVRLRHNDRYLTWYGHLKNYIVQLGQTVTAGQVIGYADSTGDVWPPPTPDNPTAGTHLHLTLVDEVEGLDGYIVNKVINPKPFLDAIQAVDLLPYFRGDGRQYTVQHSSGAQERFRTQSNPGLTFDLVKNSQYESFLSDELYIWRGLDTSPGPAPDYAERPGALRYYRQFEPGQQWARWCKRRMVIGETWTGPGHNVQFGYKSDCSPSSANSGGATNKVTLVARHSSKTWNGVTVNDVVELLTGTGETMFFGRDWGLVAWASAWGSSAVSELLPAGTPPMNKETGCFT